MELVANFYGQKLATTRKETNDSSSLIFGNICDDITYLQLLLLRLIWSECVTEVRYDLPLKLLQC